MTISSRYITSFSTEEERLLVPATNTDTDNYVWFILKTCLDFSEVYQRPYRASMMEHFLSKLHLRPFFSQSFVKPCKIHRKVSTRKSYF